MELNIGGNIINVNKTLTKPKIATIIYIYNFNAYMNVPERTINCTHIQPPKSIDFFNTIIASECYCTKSTVLIQCKKKGGLKLSFFYNIFSLLKRSNLNS